MSISVKSESQTKRRVISADRIIIYLLNGDAVGGEKKLRLV